MSREDLQKTKAEYVQNSPAGRLHRGRAKITGKDGSSGRGQTRAARKSRGQRPADPVRRPAGQGRGAGNRRRQRPAGTGRSGRIRRKRQGLPLPAGAVILALLALVLVFAAGKILRMRLRKAGPDTVPPVIELRSDPDYAVYPGQKYEEEGYTASDDRDGDLTEAVSRSVEKDRITYTVSDRAGNITVRTRQIPYAEASADTDEEEEEDAAEELGQMRESFPDEDETAAGSGRVIYLTFDDGPGQYTERLLEILRRNDVHVTFFVTGAFPVYEDMIRREYEAGHSIGIHTQTHDFERIYADADAFWEDNSRMQEIIVRQTGHPTNLMRFAGGSSNSLGTSQSPGIMQALVNQAGERGFQYFDWNVSSGDGGMEGDSAMVISRITDQIRNFDTSVVLCHDTKEYTVNAMEYLIPWLLDNGYEIRPLSVDSFPAHHLEPD